MIVGGVKISQPGIDKSCWRYSWKGKVYQISGIEKVIGIPRSIIYQGVKYKRISRKYSFYIAHFLDGSVLPMQTRASCKQFIDLPRNLILQRLRNEVCIDSPITKEEQLDIDMRKSIDVVDGQPIHVTKQRYKTMLLFKRFATMPRPDGMNSETKEWVKPAW